MSSVLRMSMQHLDERFYLTVCIWRQCRRSFFSSVCRPGLWSPVKIKYVKRWLHFVCPDRVALQHDRQCHDNCFPSCTLLEKLLLTGWSWSRSGSNLVTRWWHLSKSTIFFGNQWTRVGKKTKGFINFRCNFQIQVFLLTSENCRSCKRAYKKYLRFSKSRENGITFDFFGCFNVLSIPLDGADQGADVWQVHLTADKVLQTLQAVLKLPAWSCLQMVNLCFKCLKKRANTENHNTCSSTGVESWWGKKKKKKAMQVIREALEFDLFWCFECKKLYPFNVTLT